MIYSSGTVWENPTRSIPVLNPRYIASLVNLMPEGPEGSEGDLKQWGLELAELLSKVHQAITTLEICRDQVETGLVRKYLKILCPPHLDL